MAPIRSTQFDLSLSQTTQGVNLALFIPTEDVTTKYMSFIKSFLHKKLPTILRSKCFNAEDLPFSQEVEATELGHLFEHIMLEYLCIAKISQGFDEASFRGVTSWNWQKKAYGTFQVQFDIDKDDMCFVSPALNKTIRLFEEILLEGNTSAKPLRV